MLLCQLCGIDLSSPITLADENMEDILDTAQLLQKIEGEEEVEKMDALLSLAITGGDCNWI